VLDATLPGLASAELLPEFAGFDFDALLRKRQFACIAHGLLAIGSLARPGFAAGAEPDWESMRAV
jgi:hypothetical protein